MRVAAISVLLLAGPVAAADPSAKTAADTGISATLSSGLAFVGFEHGHYNVSAALGFARHHVIRINLAHYPETSLGAVVPADDSASISGRVKDRGISYHYYPRSVWRGYNVEVGVLSRRLDSDVSDLVATERTATDLIAGKATVGWSATSTHLFFGIGGGVAVGRETGTLTVGGFSRSQPAKMSTIDHVKVSPEFYFRIGMTFGAY